MEPHFWQQTNREESVLGSPRLKDLVRNGIVDLSHLMSPGPFTVKYGSNSAAKKLQISKSGLFQSPNYPLPGHINRWAGSLKPLWPKEAWFLPIKQSFIRGCTPLHLPMVILRRAEQSWRGAKECFRRSLPRNDTNSSRSETSRRKKRKTYKTI